MTPPSWWPQAFEPIVALRGAPPVPSQYADATLDVIPSKPLRDLLRNYGQHFEQAASTGFGPLLLGPPATYKSYASAVLVNRLHGALGFKCAWCTVPVALTRLERHRYAASTDEQIERWKQVPFLVCDDFAMVRLNSWQHDVLVEVAMARFEASKPTCWTGNVVLTPGSTQGLTEAVGAQLSRRLLERSHGYRLYVQKLAEQAWNSNSNPLGST